MALLFVAVVMALLAGGIARARGQSALLWGLFGLALGPIGVILAVLNPGKSKLPEDMAILVIGIALVLQGCCLNMFPNQPAGIVAWCAPMGSDLSTQETMQEVSDQFGNFGGFLMVFGGIAMLPGLWARAMKAKP